MIIGDEKYNELFRHMIIDAMAQGFTHPVEWVENYSRGICQPYSKLDEIDEFCNLAIKELCFWDRYCDRSNFSIDNITQEMINDWKKHHYGQ